jgi:uncharacterized protein YjbI with pentapeptide repeats
MNPSWNEWGFWLKDPESIRNLAFTIGSIAAIVGGAITVVLASMRSIAAMRQANAATETQITQLFTDAIGFLADKEKLELRLGAIYTLERIMKKSRGDRFRVLEILYSYLRENTSKRLMEGAEDQKGIAPDIQACLDVIARNAPPRPLLRKPRARLTLANADLHGVDLSGATLRRAILPGANLTGANLSHADLRGAILTGANLRAAQLQHCRFDGAELTQANMREGKLQNASLDFADVNGAVFADANLQKASLYRATAKGAIFSHANLAKATFSGADVSDAFITDCNLAGCNFRHAREIRAAGQSVMITTYRTQLVGTDFSGSSREHALFTEPAWVLTRRLFSRLRAGFQRLRSFAAGA